MPLSDALKPPANLADMVQVAANNMPPAPVTVPREQPGLATASLGPAPSVFTTEYDRIRQWFRPGTSQNRFPPLPTKANPQVNAAASSVASNTVINSSTQQIIENIAANADNDDIVVNLQTGTSYTVQVSDLSKLISITNANGGIIYLPPVAGTTVQSLHNADDGGSGAFFNSGNTTTLGSVATSAATHTIVGTAVNVGDFLFIALRSVMSPSETVSYTLTDDKGNTWTPITIQVPDGATGTDYISLFYARSITNIAIGGTITLTLKATFSGSPFNPSSNAFWVMTGLKGIDQSSSVSAATPGVGSFTFSAGPLSLNSLDTLVSIGDLTTSGIVDTIANTQGQAWSHVIGGKFEYILNAQLGSVDDVYTASDGGVSHRYGVILAAFLNAQPTDIARLPNNFFCYVENKGLGSFQLISTATIDGSSSPVTLSAGQGVLLVYDAVSQAWYTMRGMGGGGGGGGTVTHTAGPLTSGQLIVGNGAADIKTGDLTGDATTSGSTAVSVVKVNGGSIPTSAAFVATNGSNQFTAAAYTPENAANKDAASGYAGLDATTKLKVAEQQETFDAQTGTSYSVADSDRGKIITFSNTSPVAVTLPQAGASSLFIAGWWADFVNLNTGTVTITPTTSTVNGAATVVLEKGEGVRIISDGTNYAMVAGQPTIDTPNDAEILTFETATKRWRSKSIGTVGGANASQLRGNNISSATPADQDVLKWSAADNAYDLVLADGMEHGDTVWPNDSGYSALRDEFICHNASGGSGALDTNASPIGELGWALLNTPTNAGYSGGNPPHLGIFHWTPNTGSSIQAGLVLNNKFASTTSFFQSKSFALLENPGWKMSVVFRFGSDIATSSSNAATFTNKSLYLGLGGATFAAITASSGTSRPDVFMGLRYDTNNRPGTLTLSAAANHVGANTTYTGTITDGGNGAYIGLSFTVAGFTNGANNGTFTCVASSTTSLVLNNGAGVTESHAGTAAGGTPINDSTFKFEVVENPQYQETGVRHNLAGTVVDTTITPALGNWYRLDLVCTATAQIVMTLTDENNATSATHTFSSISQISQLFSSFTVTTNSVGTLAFVGSIVSSAATASIPTFQYPVLAAGSSVTFSGFTGGATSLNSTFVVENANDESGAASTPRIYMFTGHNNLSVASQTPTMSYYPALTPVLIWGNDGVSLSANQNHIEIDYFSLVWNKAIASPSTSPSAAKSRYW